MRNRREAAWRRFPVGRAMRSRRQACVVNFRFLRGARCGTWRFVALATDTSGPRYTTVGTFRQAGDGASTSSHVPRIGDRTRRYARHAARIVWNARPGVDGPGALRSEEAGL